MKKSLITVVTLPLIAVTLSGCTPHSQESLNRYADTLRKVEGVTDLNVSVSTPLPFSVQGTLNIDFTGSSEQLKHLYEVSCSTEVNASARLEITVVKDQTTAQHDVYPCGEVPVNLVEIAETYSQYGKEIQIAANEYRNNGSLHIEQEGITFTEALQYAETAQKFNGFRPQVNLEIENKIKFNADAETQKQLLTTLRTLNQQQPVLEAEYQNTLLVTLPEGTPEQLRQETAQTLQSLPQGATSTVIIAGTGTVDVTAPSSFIQLQQELNTLTYTEATAANSFGVTASVLTYTNLEQLIQHVEQNNPDNVPVRLQLIRNDKNRNTDFTTLATNTYWEVNLTTNDYTENLLPKYLIMAESGTLTGVDFQENLIAARLKEDLRTNSNAFSRGAEAMNQANRDNRFESLWLNGQEV